MRPFGVDGGGNAEGATATGSDAYLSLTFFPELAEWLPVLNRLAVPLRSVIEVAIHARREGCHFQTSLQNLGFVNRRDLLHAFAAELGVGVVEAVDPDKIIVSREHSITLLRGRNGQIPVKLAGNDGEVAFLITPERLRPAAIRQTIAARPALARHLRLVDAQKLRTALLDHASPLLARRARLGLFERSPEFSARIVANAWQGFMVGALLTLLPVGLLLARDGLLSGAHFLATIFFFSCVSLRIAALASIRKPKPNARIALSEGEKPVYSVLVALYREAAVVPDLVAAMERLVWPRDRLDIKLVCEAGDTGTLAAVAALDLPSHFEVVVVPPGGPKTKPKALDYALQIAGGELVVLYDAEDDPHPMQLVEAWQRFSKAGPDLAAVQAPLEISNRGSSLIARMFAFEYAAQFRGLLPWLANRGLILPLGGTSNHFRREALEAAGGWDPFNVTEDADLGMRLKRLGYRTEIISCPTIEAAPTRFEIWLPQRTRWFKGWTQTWLVHMRNPARLSRELGFKSFLISQVLFAGMLASVLLHPLLVATFGYFSVTLLFSRPIGALGTTLLAMDVINVVSGYLSFLLLGWLTLTGRERWGFWKIVLFTPLYWVMLSLAGWRAVFQLWRKPHHWEKTPHEPARGAPGPRRPHRPTSSGTPVLRR